MRAGQLVRVIEKHGLLPMHDAKVTSATALIAKEPIRGSWWGHPKGKEIFNVLESAGDHEDVETVKLLGRKLTLVHRRLWLALYSMVTAGEPWQMDGLAASATTALARIDAAQRVRADALQDDKREAQRLADRLLVFHTSVHTEAGRHEKVYESWATWRRRRDLRGRRLTAKKARAALEEAAAPFAPLALPW